MRDCPRRRRCGRFGSNSRRARALDGGRRLLNRRCGRCITCVVFGSVSQDAVASRPKAVLALNRSVHRLDQVSRSLSSADWVGSVVEIVEHGLDVWAGVHRVHSGGISGSDRASTASMVRWPWCSAAGRSGTGSSRAEILAPGRSAFTDGQMSWGEGAFDADLAATVLRDLVDAPALYAGDVELGKSVGGHAVMIAGHNPPAGQAAAASVWARARGGASPRTCTATTGEQAGQHACQTWRTH